MHCLTLTENQEPMLTFPVPKSKITSAVWGPLEETIITGHENGDINLWDMKVRIFLEVNLSMGFNKCSLEHCDNMFNFAFPEH